MKYCTYCGKELFDEAVICPACGCVVSTVQKKTNHMNLVVLLSEKVKMNGIIWIVIAITQIWFGFTLDWFLLIVGVLNIVSAIQDLNYSKTVCDNPTGIVKKYEPLAGPIIVLVYNLIFGGLIGVIGSAYYFLGIRAFVLDNQLAFNEIETIAGNKSQENVF